MFAGERVSDGPLFAKSGAKTFIALVCVVILHPSRVRDGRERANAASPKRERALFVGVCALR